MLASLPVQARSGGVITSFPRAHAVVDGRRVMISLRFAVPVDHRRSRLLLKSKRGQKELKPRLSSAPKYLFSMVGQLAPGAYELCWTARLSSGQTLDGTIPFVVRTQRIAASSGPLPPLLEPAEHQ